jgi:hypothetical protein
VDHPELQDPGHGTFHENLTLNDEGDVGGGQNDETQEEEKVQAGGKCSYQVCAFSNHTTADQAEEEEEGQKER